MIFIVTLIGIVGWSVSLIKIYPYTIQTDNVKKMPQYIYLLPFSLATIMLLVWRGVLIGFS